MSRAMKDSGIPWIGEIPKEWNVSLIASCIKEVDCKNTDGKEDNALQFKMGTIISKRNGDSKYNPETLEAYNIVKVGDIIINGLNLSFDLISQRVGLVKENGVITSTYIAVRPTINISNEFLTYLFKAYDNCKAFHSMGRGLRQTLSYGELRKYYVVLPLKEEQQRIVEFLDRKCTEIDEAIALQEEFIEELKSYKQSVITEAVTRGLNPNVKLKDSGIDWIGKIPQEWDVCRIKDIFVLRTGTTPKGFEQEIDTDTFVNWFTPSDVSEMNCEISYSERHLSKKLVEKEGIELSPIGSLIFVGIGASAGKVGYAMVEGYSNQQITMLIPKGDVCFSKYSYYYMIADRKRIRDNAFFTTLPIINNSYLSGIRTLFPPLPEQKQIADYLDNKCTEIDRLIAIKQQKIEELKDYKKSVIYEYVTGKKEVN